MPPAVVGLAFDPTLTVLGRAIRLDTLADALAILVGLVTAALLARAAGHDVRGRELRRDDLLYISLGIVPGAVIGGRLGYVLLHLDYYRDRPGVILDPAQGGLELTLGVLAGLVTGACVGRLLDAPIGRWAHAAAIPALLAIGIGKVGQALGGAGQGSPSDVAWATAYGGAGPWGSLAPSVPSHPAQLYEAVVVALVLLAALAVLASGASVRRDGRLLVGLLVAWLIGRFAVAFTWRDAPVLGPLRAGQLLIGAELAVLALAWLLMRRRAPDRPAAEPSWPDPTISHRWRDVRAVTPGGEGGPALAARSIVAGPENERPALGETRGRP